MRRKAEINFRIVLDENQMPESIEWNATDSGNPGYKFCDSILISLWDKQTKDALGIDLWTKDMTIDDMNVFIHQTLIKLAKTYTDATKDRSTADLLNVCAEQFADKLKLIKRG